VYGVLKRFVGGSLIVILVKTWVGPLFFGPYKTHWNTIYKLKPLQSKSELIKCQIS